MINYNTAVITNKHRKLNYLILGLAHMFIHMGEN